MTTVHVLRKVYGNPEKGYSSGYKPHFKYPSEIGAWIEAPDWNPEPECGGGLHGLANAEGNWYLLDGNTYMVLEVDTKDLVHIDNQKCKFRGGYVRYIGNKPPFEMFDLNRFDSELAYYWGCNIGDGRVMRDRVTDSTWAYSWALEIGDREVMRDRVTNSWWAYAWARDIGDKEIMRDRVTGSKWAYRWALEIGDREIMRDRVTEPKWAYAWARDIGDKEIMAGICEGTNREFGTT